MINFTQKLINEKKYDFRDSIFSSIISLIKKDKNLIVLTNDLGARGIDEIKKIAPNQFINVGIAEQNLISVASGLALTGKKVIIYGILSHILYRGFEQIKLDVCFQNLPIQFVCVGSGLAYGNDGPTHQSLEDLSVLRALNNIDIYNPSDDTSARFSILEAYKSKKPAFIKIDKEQLPKLYKNFTDVKKGILMTSAKKSVKVIIISSGIISWHSLYIQEQLEKINIPTSVYDVVRPNKFDLKKIARNKFNVIVVLEEAYDSGGLADIVTRNLIENQIIYKKFLAFNIGKKYLIGSAKREWVWKKFFDVNKIISLIK